MEKKKVLLCYLRLKKPADQLWEYTGLFYLAAALTRSGFTPLVWHEDWRGALDAALTHLPLCLGFSCDAENQHFLEGFIPRIRRELEERTGKHHTIVVGGPQAMSLGREFLEHSGADAVLRGEGEETLPGLLSLLEKRQLSGPASLKPEDIPYPGIAWLDEQGAYHEKSGIGLVEDLRTLPRPAYQASLHRRLYGRVIFTGRGCPFSCAFCASNVGHQKLRLRKISDVLAEINDNLEREPRIRFLILQDDTFCTSVDRVREFCAGMRLIREKRPIVWFCETHVRTILRNRELLREMVESGLVRMQIGMESGDPAVLKQYRKNVTPEEELELVQMAVDVGLPQIAGNFIIGGPPEKEGATEAFIRKLLRVGAGITDISTGFLRAYPFTAISKDPSSYGLRLLSDDKRSAGDDFPSVIPEGMTAEEVTALRQTCNKAVREEIDRCIRKRLIPLERVMAQMRLNEEYGISSRWIKELSVRAMVYEYYRMIYLKEGQPYSRSLPSEYVYPQRTFQFYRGVVNRDGIYHLDGTILSPLERDLLFYCAGKLTIVQIVEALWEKYGDSYEDQGELLDAVENLLEQADSHYWITVFVFDESTAGAHT